MVTSVWIYDVMQSLTSAVVIILMFVVGRVSAYDQYSTAYLQDSCTCSAIDHLRCQEFRLDPMPQGAGNVALSRTPAFHKEFFCEFTIMAPSRHHRIMLTVNYMDIPLTKGCKSGMLKIYDGPLGDQPVQLTSLCGTELPQYSFRSNSDRVTLAYHQDRTIVHNNKSFNLTFTYFRFKTPVTCNSSREFACRNSLCIPSVLECDGWNNCGDATDETVDHHVCGKLMTSSDPMVGLAVGVTVASILVIVMVTLIAYGAQRRKGPFFHETVAMTTVQTSDMNRSTNSPQDIPYPMPSHQVPTTSSSMPSHSSTADAAARVPLVHVHNNPLSHVAVWRDLNKLIGHRDIVADDTASVASSSDLYAMGLHKDPPPPSYNSLFPNLG